MTKLDLIRILLAINLISSALAASGSGSATNKSINLQFSTLQTQLSILKASNTLSHQFSDSDASDSTHGCSRTGKVSTLEALCTKKNGLFSSGRN